MCPQVIVGKFLTDGKKDVIVGATSNASVSKFPLQVVGHQFLVLTSNLQLILLQESQSEAVRITIVMVEVNS